LAVLGRRLVNHLSAVAAVAAAVAAAAIASATSAVPTGFVPMAAAAIAVALIVAAAAILLAAAAIILAAIFRRLALRFARLMAGRMTRRAATMMAAASATARVGLRFQADQDHSHGCQTQGQAKQISIHDVPPMRKRLPTMLLAFIAADLQSGSLTAASVLDHGSNPASRCPVSEPMVVA
jgi:hypothetical protein